MGRQSSWDESFTSANLHYEFAKQEFKGKTRLSSKLLDQSNFNPQDDCQGDYNPSVERKQACRVNGIQHYKTAETNSLKQKLLLQGWATPLSKTTHPPLARTDFLLP